MKTNVQAKLSRAHAKPLTLGAVFVGLCLAGLSAQAYVISDNFDLVGTGRTNGATLNGTVTMTGGATWATNNGTFVFGGTGTNGYVSCSNVDYATAVVGLTSAATDIVNIQAKMHPHGVGPWLGMQLGTAAGTGWDTGGLFMLVNGAPGNSGSIQVLANNVNIINFLVTDYTYDPNGFNLYSMTYNGMTQKFSLWANGTALTTDYQLTVPYIPGTFVKAGLYDALNAAGEASFDNFQVSVPEPAALALLAMGVLTLTIQRGRRG